MIRFTAESNFRLCDATTLRKLASMRRHGQMTDLTLICDNSFYPIHRLVLGASSNHLSDEFYSETNGKVKKPSTIMIPDATPIDMENLITYMYSGQVVIPENELDGLMRVANCLKIDGLKEKLGVRVPGYIAPLKSSGKSKGKKSGRKDKKFRNVTSVPDRAGAGSRESRRNDCQDEEQFPDETDTLNSIYFEPIMSSTLLGDINNSPRPLPRRVQQLKQTGPGMPAKERKNANGQPSKSRRTRPRISPMASTSSGNVSSHLGESYLERKLKGRKMHNASGSMYATKVVAKKTGLKRDRIGEFNQSVRKAGKRTPANERTTTHEAPKVHKHKSGTSKAGGSTSGHGIHKFGPRKSTTLISGVGLMKQGKARPLTPYPKYSERPLKRLQGSEKPIHVDPKLKSRVSCVVVRMALTSTQKTSTVVQVIPKVAEINLALGPGKSAVSGQSGVSPMKSCQTSGRKDKIPGEESKEPPKSVVGINEALVGKKGRRPRKFNTEVESAVEKRKHYNTRASKKAQLQLALATEEEEDEELVYRGRK